LSLRGHRLLYDPAHEHDACGVGFVADVSGQRSHRILELSNGVAFVLDEHHEFYQRYNPELVEIRRLGEISDEEIVLRDVVEQHVAATGSRRGRQILDHWTHYLPLFYKVAPFPPAQQVKPVEMLPEDEDEPTAPRSDNGAASRSPTPGSPVGRIGLPDRTRLPNIAWSGRSRHPQTAST